MRKISLIGALIIIVAILIIAFENWSTYPIMIFFSSFNTSLTISFMFMSFLGFCSGFLLGLYFINSSEDNNEIKEKKDDENDF
jgi:uncharacterized integral membrane protein